MFNFGKGNNPTSKNSSAKVTLTKAEEGLERHIVRLKKERNVDLSGHKARVFVVLDRSGSMDYLYRHGDVQEVLTRLLPLALKFDDNGELEVYLFHDSCTQMPSMNIRNYENYVEEKLKRASWGGTCYAPAVNKTVDAYNDGSLLPAFGIFITDGANSDERATDRAIRKSSKYKIFYQFVGIGNANFRYLQKLDDLDGRAVDNTAFIKVSDFSQLDDDQLYAKLLEQYPDWLQAMNIR